MLYHHYGITQSTEFHALNGHELEDLTAATVELRHAFKQLEWYGIVNFNKILGRLRKFRPERIRNPGIHDLEVYDTQLAIQAECSHHREGLNKLLAKLDSNRLQAHSVSKTRSLFLQKLCGQCRASLPSSNRIYNALNRDDDSILDQILDNKNCGDELYFPLLHYSAILGSKRCIDRLLSETRSLQDNGNHLHWLVIKTGREKKVWDRSNRDFNTGPTSTATEAINRLVYIIHRLGSAAKLALYKKDSFGRLPIHHATYYGLSEVCQEILKHMTGQEESPFPISSSAGLLPDCEGFTAFDLAVSTGNAAIVRILLENHRKSMNTGNTANTLYPDILPGILLTTALRLDCYEIVQLLNSSNIEINSTDYNGQSALHLAVRSGRADYVKILLEVSEYHDQANADVTESVYGWTPLILACVKGNSSIMELLLAVGASPRIRDLFGWTAKDHAAFRGHLSIAEKLIALEVKTPVSINGTPWAGQMIKDYQKKEYRIRKARPTFGHGESFSQIIPPDCSQILVNLGSLDSSKNLTAIDLSSYTSPDPYTPQSEADFQVEIRAVDGNQSSHLVQLPIIEDMANKPWRFLTKDASNFKLVFNIFHAHSALQTDPFLGSAIALLESLKQGLGSKRESLIRDFTIPILEKNTLKFIGTVTFYFIVVKPLAYSGQVPRVGQDLGKHNSPTIIGHRGAGQNDPSRKQLQIGENTVQSFLSAVDLGASYIEFDVQITKDNVPIVYHDFLMSETGLDAPLHNVNLEQFIHVVEAQSTLAALPCMAETRYLERCGDRTHAGRRPRSYSLNVYEQSEAKSLAKRMEHTFECKVSKRKGLDAFKGNTRSEYIQASYMTLEKLFVELPESIRFSIEIKYPMLSEAEDWEMDTYAVELNLLVDTVLETTYRLAGNRAIFFASFSPEICILVAAKQDIYPVFFLTDSGETPSKDARASSLQEAIHFAKSWHLPGVILRSDPLVMSPEFVQYVKDSGLLCMSWGELNDDPEHAKTQAKAGLDAIIVNSVHLISQTLKGNME